MCPPAGSLATALLRTVPPGGRPGPAHSGSDKSRRHRCASEDEVLVNVDDNFETAWRAFQHRLVADLIDLGHGSTLRIEVPTGRGGRSALGLDFRGRPKTILVSATGSPPGVNAGPGPRREPPAAVCSPRVFTRRTEPQISAWAVGILRAAYGVIHPAFLVVLRRDSSGDPFDVGAAKTGSTGGGVTASEIESYVLPTSPDQLDDLVERTLSVELSTPLNRDSTGEIALTCDHGMAFVRVHSHQPVVEVYAILDRDCDHTAALAYVNRQNDSSRLVTHYVGRIYVVAHVSVWSSPYVPATLLRAVKAIETALADYAHRETPVGDSAPAFDRDDSSWMNSRPNC